MTEDRDTFWIVWCPTGTAPPSHRHEHYEQAVREAERLATLAPGKEFYVMGAEAMRVVDNMKRVTFSREIPF
ncbi:MULTISPECIES: hypothetical protein [unclassified Caballeronia]|uniref:hypothetical protein n=1 Tax=unclassified Caballeronia TaxID=2646786 RepID=UPI001F18920A|nr:MULTISPECIES: hypothetical protein [unclassified Caballeronia]MCE4544622.1 hypothetical protein [Caballeronia sp. PC1]MCE4571774.1 hypothetical protein [Caballeronia sp. CLC5]